MKKYYCQWHKPKLADLNYVLVEKKPKQTIMKKNGNSYSHLFEFGTLSDGLDLTLLLEKRSLMHTRPCRTEMLNRGIKPVRIQESAVSLYRNPKSASDFIRNGKKFRDRVKHNCLLKQRARLAREQENLRVSLLILKDWAREKADRRDKAFFTDKLTWMVTDNDYVYYKTPNNYRRSLHNLVAKLANWHPHKLVMWTLTFATEPNVTEYKNLMRKFMTRTRNWYRRHNVHFSYVWRAELGSKNGRIHFHLLVDGFLKHDDMMRLWGLGGVNFLKPKDKNGRPLSPEKAKLYISKYASKTSDKRMESYDMDERVKSLESRRINANLPGRKWSTSRDIPPLNPPKPINPNPEPVIRTHDNTVYAFSHLDNLVSRKMYLRREYNEKGFDYIASFRIAEKDAINYKLMFNCRHTVRLVRNGCLDMVEPWIKKKLLVSLDKFHISEITDAKIELEVRKLYLEQILTQHKRLGNKQQLKFAYCKKHRLPMDSNVFLY